MKQKYHIWRNTKNRELVIQENAVLSGGIKRKDFPEVQEDEYSLLSEHVYDARAVSGSISNGKFSLISLLRTQHFFPVGQYMDKIAETVIKMFAARGEQTENLVFDDKDYIYGDQEEEEIEEEIEDESDDEPSSEIYDLLKDDIKLKKRYPPTTRIMSLSTKKSHSMFLSVRSHHLGRIYTILMRILIIVKSDLKFKVI